MIRGSTVQRLRLRVQALDLVVQGIAIALIPYWVCLALGALFIDMLLAFCQIAPPMVHEPAICLAGLLASASIVVMSVVMLLNAIFGARGSLISRLRRPSYALFWGWSAGYAAVAAGTALVKLLAGMRP